MTTQTRPNYDRPLFNFHNVSGTPVIIEWNYKYAGSAFWMTVAWAEAAVLDLLGKATGKSIGDLLGGRKRDQVPVYVSSLIRETTPEEEVECSTTAASSATTARTSSPGTTDCR